MKYNLSMIERCLPLSIIADTHIDDLYCFPISYVAFPEGNIFRNNVLYISEGEMLPENPEIEDRCALISIGRPPEVYQNRKEVDILILKEKVPVREIFNRVQRICRKYEEWECQIIEMLIGDEAYEQIGKKIYELFHNSVQLYNQWDQLLFNIYDPRNPIAVEQCQRYDDPDYLYEELRIVSLKPEFQEYYAVKDLCVVSQEFSKCQMVFINLFHNDIYAGKIFLIETEKTFCSGDFSLLKYVVLLLEKYSSEKVEFSPFPDSFSELLKRMCHTEGKVVGQKNAVLELSGWKTSDSYMIIYVHSMNHYINIKMIRNSFVLMQLDGTDYCIIQEEDKSSLTILFNLSKVSYNKSWIISGLNSFVEKHEYIGGYSAVFNNLEVCHTHYLQARAATNLHLFEKKYTLFSFEDSLTGYVHDLCLKNCSIDFYITEDIRKLIDYDTNHSSELVKTLATYLNEEMNIAKTTELLHIHRSTFIYRLNQIEKVSGIQLKEKECRLRIRFVLFLMGVL